MSEKINSVTFDSINLSPGGPSADLSRSPRQYPASNGVLPGTSLLASTSTNSSQERASTVQERFDEAGSNVRVGVESVDGGTVFTIRDAETGQVIRKIPSDEALRISKNIDRMTGVYLDRIE